MGGLCTTLVVATEGGQGCERGATAAFAQAVQVYCDELRPWLNPEDYPLFPQQQFTLLDYCEMDKAEDVWVRLSPEGYAVFRAWLRRKALLGLEDEPGWN